MMLQYIEQHTRPITDKIKEALLAERSGVNLRNIHVYEQRENEIDRAQAKILYKLSRVLGCDVEDLLENPME